MPKRRRGRPVDGFLVLDKPQGISSSQAVQKAKRLYNAQKVGHTGSLDPIATGVLPLCFGEATKFSQYLLASDKKYWTRIRLGVATDTGDADGEIVSERPVDGITEADVERELAGFRGQFDQVPSMFSAIKHQGQPLYKLARQGVEVERKARQVTVFENRLAAFEGDTLELEIHCSKGTYVRTIAEDLGEALGCGAHVIALRRRAAGPFTEDELVAFDDMEAACSNRAGDALLQPIESAVRMWPRLVLEEASAYYLRQGQPVIVPRAPTEGFVRLAARNADGEEQFIGVGEILDDGRVAPRRLLANVQL